CSSSFTALWPKPPAVPDRLALLSIAARFTKARKPAKSSTPCSPWDSANPGRTHSRKSPASVKWTPPRFATTSPRSRNGWTSRTKANQSAGRFVCQLSRQRPAEFPQHRRSISSKRAAVHASQHFRIQQREPFQDRFRPLRVREIIQRPSKLFARPDHVVLSHRWALGAALGKQITAEQSLCGVIKKHAAVPTMRNMGRIDPLQLVRPRREPLPVCQPAPRAIGEVIHCNHRADVARKRSSMRSDRQEFIQCARLVRLEVGKPDVPQLLRWNHR